MSNIKQNILLKVYHPFDPKPSPTVSPTCLFFIENVQHYVVKFLRNFMSETGN